MDENYGYKSERDNEYDDYRRRRSRQCSGDSSPVEKPLDDVKSPILADVGSLPSSTNIPASDQLLALLLKIIKTKQSKKNYLSSSLYSRK
ncbi:hypothetical protein RYX36_022447, partial [Vicia faba]